MRTSDFHFDLPDHLIARYPLAERTESRLLELDGISGNVTDRTFMDIVDLLEPGDLLVFNNTKVIPARVFGHKSSGGKLEILVERLLDDTHILAHIKCSRSPKPGQIIILAGIEVTVLSREGALFHLQFPSSVTDILNQHGHMPLPPYIDREDDSSDRERYQTVYATTPGAVAAPTAGLHFDKALMEKLESKGIQFAYVTLHVGAGTFQPVKVDDISEHVMHAEYIEVDQSVVDAVLQTRANGRKVVAVGTTSIRSLESASQSGCIAPFKGDSKIFIYPGYQFKSVDAVITNFHLPESTLIMLVAAFSGQAHTLNAYRHAVENEYRFFSYGDAMFLSRPHHSPLGSTL